MSIKNAISLFSTEACARNVFPFFSPIPSINSINLIWYLMFWFLSEVKKTKLRTIVNLFWFLS
jgi:hypothetical protein